MRHRTLLALVSILAVTVAASAQDRPGRARPRPSVVVTGTGEARGKPDIAYIQAGVVTQAETAGAAVERNSAATAEFIAALKRQGVQEDDIQTVRFDLAPQYKHDPEGRTPPTVVGYEAANEVRLTVRDLKRLGQLLDAAVEAGANRISGISFDIEDRRKILDEARREAIDDARHAAEVYADQAGIGLGGVVSIREQPTAGPPQPFAAPRAFAAAEMAVPISPGEQTLSVTIEVTYAIERRRPAAEDENTERR